MMADTKANGELGAVAPRPRESGGSVGRQILLIAPQAPPYGGMGLQAELLRQLLESDGQRVIFVPSNPPLPRPLRWCERVRGLKAFLRFFVFCRNLWGKLPEAEVVHLMGASWLYFFLVVFPGAGLSSLRGKRVILNYHGGEAEGFLRRYGWLASPVLRLADVVTAPSGFLAEVLQRHSRVSISIVPNVVDSSQFPHRLRVAVRPRMLVTRHLEKLYDIEAILRAFQEIQETKPEAALRIAGTGREEASLRSLSRQLGLRNVSFLGHLPHSELAAVYSDCDILLNASRADNFPGSLIEASAAGLVIVSTGVGGIPFIYQEGENALLVQPGNWRELASAVERVLLDPELAKRLSAAGLEVARRCGWQNVRQQLYRAYGFAAAESIHERPAGAVYQAAAAQAGRKI